MDKRQSLFKLKIVFQELIVFYTFNSVRTRPSCLFVAFFYVLSNTISER